MIVVVGASGFVGHALCASLRAAGREVTTVGRGATSDVRWDGTGLPGDELVARLRGAAAVVNLAGATIGRRWTAARKIEIRESRATLTAHLARAVANAKPAAFISGSAVGFYGDTGDAWVDEASPRGRGFLADTAVAWESAADAARDAGVRVVHPRLGVVLGPGGGMVAQLRPPFSLGAGGRLGDGRQWLAWISLDDCVRALVACVDDVRARGPVNLVSPNPVTNAEFTEAFARAVHRPAIVPAPAFALRAAFGAMADEMLLAGQRVRPAKLASMGFAFAHPAIDDALRVAVAA